MPLLGVNDFEGTNQDQPGKLKRKRREEKTPVNVDEPSMTCRIHTNYKCLNEQGNRTEYLEDAFDEGDDQTSLITKETYAVMAGDELNSLAEAKHTPDWPKWWKGMEEEIKMLNEKGTWKLVEKPPDVIPISNKWTFVRKGDKEGIITCYRA
jgi:hypothetical protein